MKSFKIIYSGQVSILTGWQFPSNGGGAINGVADSGVEIFRGKEIPSLAREICQNSLDAAVDEKSAVTVEFQRCEIAPTDIPDARNFSDVLSRCLAFWRNKSVKTEAFIKVAISKLKGISAVLRISDFNTTGLAEPFNPRAMTGWNTLTKINGGAIKSDDKAGNFGIGKNAPFANSYLRLVFYRTFNANGEFAAQGVAKLVSFDIDDWNIATGTGYFGDMNGNLPVRNIPSLDKIYKRTKRGTDVFIYGFNGSEDWANSLVDELIKNFLVAIHRDKLRVKVHGVTLDKNNLGKLVKDDAANYYRILTGDAAVKYFETNFYDLGKLKLRVLLDPTTKLNRKVLIVRKSGMKLFELDRFSRTLNFTAILELEGFKLNAFFRQMETPDHTNWEPTRHPTDPKRAKEHLKELKRWVRDMIESLGKENFSDEVNVEGLSRMLDFDDAAINGGNSKQVETLDAPAQQENSWQKLSPHVETSKNISMTTSGSDNSKTQRTTGTVTNTGTKPAIRKLGGTRRRQTYETHTGKENPDGRDTVLNPVGKPIACDKVRAIKIGGNKYRLIVKVAQKVSSGWIEIFASVEDGERQKLPVTQANSIDTNSNAQVSGDKIRFRNLRGGRDAKINFELADEKSYTLEVAVHED